MTVHTTQAPTQTGGAARAITVAVAPLLFLGAMVWHPPLPGRLPDADAVADAAAGDITRWGLVHIATAVASALVAVAFIVVRSWLRERGDALLSGVGLGFVVIGSTLYAMLPGMEMSLLAAHETGGDLAATQDALKSWFVPILLGGAALFAVGTILFAVAVVRVAPRGRTETAVIAGALVIFGLSRMIPVGAVQFYVQSGAALLALLPLAAQISAEARRAGTGAGR